MLQCPQCTCSQGMNQLELLTECDHCRWWFLLTAQYNAMICHYVWRKKGEACKPKNTIPRVGVLCCRRDWCTSQNRWHHEERKLCGYIEATSQDTSHEVKAWSSKWTMTLSILPKLWQNGLRTTKSRYWSGLHKALTSIL